MNARPDFSKYEIASVAARKRWSKAFLALCAVTSTFSIVILIVLITTIIVSALPVFGPHSDRLEAASRSLFYRNPDQADDAALIQDGDLLQGVFQAERLFRGGLGNENDEFFFTEDGSEPVKTVLGLYSWQVTDQTEKIGSMVAAPGEQSIGSLLQRLNIDAPEGVDRAAIAVLSTDSVELKEEDLEIDGPLIGDKLIEQLSAVDGWELMLLAGPEAETDFAEVRFPDANGGELAEVRKTRVRKRAGQLKILTSIQYDATHPAGTYKPVRLRSYKTNEIVTGDLKIDEGALTGISRRKRKGFDLGGDFHLEWCPVPEPHASTSRHVAHFLKEKPSGSDPTIAGIGPALWGSIWACAFCALFALPLGIATAVFLEEFQPTNRILCFLQGLVQLNITNLAGVPSIVYGILGLTAFATMYGVFGSDKEPTFRFGGDYYFQYLSESLNPILVPIDGADDVPELVNGMAAQDGDHNPVTLTVIGPDDDLPEDDATLQWTIRSDAQGGVISEKPWYYFQIPFGRGVLAAALTLMLVILPVIIIASQEAIKAVPPSLREGAMGLGATRWQVVRNVTLPAAIPGIMTGAILSISRAIGEAAPLVVICGVVYISKAPEHLMDYISVLPIQIFYLTGQPPDDEGLINFQNVAAATSLVLLVVLLTFNTIAIVLRQFTSKPLS